MLHNRVLTKENFETIFMCFAKNCINNGLKEPIDIYIVGGAAIVFNFDFRESTIDVDAMFKSDKTIVLAIKETAKQLGLQEDWLNQDFINTPSYSPKLKDVSVLYKTYLQIVNVFLIKPIYLIAMKIKSSRPTGGDLGDITKMIYELRIKKEACSYDDVIKAYKYLYTDFSNTYDYFLEKTKEAFEMPLEDIESITKSVF